MSATTDRPIPRSHAAEAFGADPKDQVRVVHGVLAEFETPGELMHAAEAMRDAGYRSWDCHSPFPVHGLEKAMGVGMTKLPIFIFCCGAVGCLIGFLLQWFTNATELTVYAPMSVVGYPFEISGKPTLSGPTYPIVMFELTILFSAFGATFGMLGFNRLPRLYHPLFKSARFRRVTTDRFFISVESIDPRFDEEETSGLLRRMGATAVEVVEE